MDLALVRTEQEKYIFLLVCTQKNNYPDKTIFTQGPLSLCSGAFDVITGSSSTDGVRCVVMDHRLYWALLLLSTLANNYLLLGTCLSSKF